MTFEQLREALITLHVADHFTVMHEEGPAEVEFTVDPARETVNLSIKVKL